MTHFRRAALLAWVFIGGLAASSFAASALDFPILMNYDLLGDGSVEMYGRMYAPTDLAPGEKRPLVMFLHGIDERGSNNSSQVNSNINGLLEAAKANRFFLYAPQLDAASGSWSTAKIDVALGMVAKATQNYAIDTSSLYVTGISLGGGGAKVAITTYRDTFAAAVPLSAVDTSGQNASQLVGKPIWLFHGPSDSVVNVSVSDNFANAIRAADGKPAIDFSAVGNAGSPYPYTYTYVTPNTTVDADFYNENNLRYTRYTSGGHATKLWTQAYRETWLYDWMLAQKNPLRQPQNDESVLFDLGTSSLSGNDNQGRTWNAPLAGEEQTQQVALPFAKLTAGTRTSVSLSVTDKFTGTANRGLTTGTGYSAAVSQDTWTVSADDPGTIVLDGLTVGQLYRITIFASDSDSDGGRGRMTRYTIGQAHRDLEIYNNATNKAIFENVLADAAGRITLTVSVAPGTTARYGGIGTVELMAVIPEPASVALLGILIPVVLHRRK